MTKRVLAATFLGTVAWLVGSPVEAWAFGKHKYNSGDCNSCGGVVVAASPCGEAAPCAPAPAQYVTQTVTRYRAEYKNQQVQVTRMVATTEQQSFTYTVMVPVTKAEKRQVTTYQTVSKPEEYSYTVNELVTTTEKRQVTECTQVIKNEEFTYNEVVPVTQMEKRTVCHVECVPTQVTEMRTVCRTVRVPVCPDACAPVVCCDEPQRRGLFSRLCGKNKRNDDCGPQYVTQRIVEQVPCTRTVVQYVTHSKEVEVPVTTYTTVAKKGTRQVCHLVPVAKEVNVNVTRCVPVVKKGTRTVCSVVPVTQEVTVNVVHCVAETKTGVRNVTVCKPVTETVTQQVCTMVPYTETIQVPVNTGCGFVGGCGGAAHHHHHSGCCN